MSEPRTPRGPFVAGDDGESRRLRMPSPLATVPRSERRAELVCERTPDRPTVAAIVHGETVTTDRTTHHLGANFALPCRCGFIHIIDGEQLQRAVLAAPVASGRVPTVAIPRVVLD